MLLFIISLEYFNFPNYPSVSLCLTSIFSSFLCVIHTFLSESSLERQVHELCFSIVRVHLFNAPLLWASERQAAVQIVMFMKRSSCFIYLFFSYSVFYFNISVFEFVLIVYPGSMYCFTSVDFILVVRLTLMRSLFIVNLNSCYFTQNFLEYFCVSRV